MENNIEIDEYVMWKQKEGWDIEGKKTKEGKVVCSVCKYYLVTQLFESSRRQTVKLREGKQF